MHINRHAHRETDRQTDKRAVWNTHSHANTAIYWLIVVCIIITDINECNSHPCQNNGTCLDQINGSLCSCVKGFVGDSCEIGKYLVTSTERVHPHIYIQFKITYADQI